MNETIKILQDNRHGILSSWMQRQYSNQLLGTEMLDDREFYADSDQFVNCFLDNLSADNIEAYNYDAFAAAKDLLLNISTSPKNKTFSISETTRYILNLKNALTDCLQTKMQNLEDMSRECAKISRLLDEFGTDTLDLFLRNREAFIVKEKYDSGKVATPVLQMWDGILVIPVIGVIDHDRAETITETVLNEIRRTGYSIVIIDISGVAAVDAEVAASLLRTAAAIRLMGGDCIISGVKPKIALSMINLGLDLSGVQSKVTLADALKASFELLGFKLVKK